MQLTHQQLINIFEYLLFYGAVLCTPNRLSKDIVDGGIW